LYKLPSSLLTIYSRAGYPSWTLEGRHLRIANTNGLLSLLFICSRAGYPSWTLEEHQFGGHDHNMAFKSSYHLQPCWLPKLDTGGASVAGHDYKWPSSLLTICSCAGYLIWTLEGRQLGVTTTNELQVFLPFVAVMYPKLDAGGASVGGHDSNMAFE